LARPHPFAPNGLEREGEAGDAPAQGEHIDTLTPYDAEL